MMLEKLTAADIMTEKVVSFKGDASLLDVTKTLLEKQISGAPVIDRDGKLAGIITEEDIIAVMKDRDEVLIDQPINRIQSLGTSLIVRDVVSVSPDTPLTDVITRLIIRKVRRLPVIDDAHTVVGIVSRRDVLRAMLRAK